ncbi:MAG: LamG domain-containing protein [Victivallales bacterium]|nr:LamG domain-containing protein [Victivallales bacterium]
MTEQKLKNNSPILHSDIKDNSKTGSSLIKLVLTCLLAILSSYSYAKNPQRLFYASFDDTAEATDYSNSIIKPVKSKEIYFSKGIRGQALDTKKVQCLAYDWPKKLSPERGTVMFWYCPEWKDSSARLPIRYLFSTDMPLDMRVPYLSIFAWSSCVRGDIMSEKRKIEKGGNRLENGQWSHIALTWDGTDTILYIDGLCCDLSNSFSALNLMLRPGTKLKPVSTEKLRNLSKIYIGYDPREKYTSAEGLIDELEIWSAPLSEQEIRQKAAELSPLYASRSINRYILADTIGEKPMFELINSGDETLTYKWKCIDSSGKKLAESTKEEKLKGGEKQILTPSLAAASHGRGQLIVTSANGKVLLKREIMVMTKKNPYSSSKHNLQLEPLFTIQPHKIQNDKERFASIGKCRTGELGEVKYLETGSRRCDRFAVRMTFLENNQLYLVEIDYPDDCKRTADIVFQESSNSHPNFELQVGYLTGDDGMITNRINTSSRIYFPSARDVTMIVMGAREASPAAVSEIRVSRISGGLSEAKIVPAAPVNGTQRTVGINFEDPSIATQFGMDPFSANGAIELADRLSAYMKYSGQDSLFYPVVFYGAPVDDMYLGRAHGVGWLGALSRRFQESRLGFYATFNMYALPRVDVHPDKVVPGEYNDSVFSILSSGLPSTSGLHHHPPLFNIMHPDVEKYVKSCIDSVLEEIGTSPALKGFVFNMSPRSFLSFGSLEAGYNDYTIAAFKHDTGIEIPVDPNDPMRGKLYAKWLLANEKDRWISWRGKILAEFYKKTAQYIRKKRKDTVLVINPRFQYYRDVQKAAFMDLNYTTTKLRAAGFAPELYTENSGIVFMMTAFPSDYRHREDKGDGKRQKQQMLQVSESKEYYSLMNLAALPGLHLHDRYWESQVGCSPEKPRTRNFKSKDYPNKLKTSWLDETIWRVSTLNLSGRNFLKAYVLPLRYGDIMNFSKGGFLIGTYGSEPYLTEFSRALRALPAKKFHDLKLDSPTVRLRELKLNNTYWYYLVNTSNDSAIVSVEFSGKVHELSSGQELNAGGQLIKLAPWQLRSFSSSSPIRSYEMGK